MNINEQKYNVGVYAGTLTIEINGKYKTANELQPGDILYCIYDDLRTGLIERKIKLEMVLKIERAYDGDNERYQEDRFKNNECKAYICTRLDKRYKNEIIVVVKNRDGLQKNGENVACYPVIRDIKTDEFLKYKGERMFFDPQAVVDYAEASYNSWLNSANTKADVVRSKMKMTAAILKDAEKEIEEKTKKIKQFM